jgi:hypothetical protein
MRGHLLQVLARAGYGASAVCRGYAGDAMNSNELAEHGSALSVVCMKNITPKPIDWLWNQQIALGKVTLIAGDPGIGKSVLTAAIAAHVTTGSPWPVCGTKPRLGGVIMLSAEDDPEDTIRPRLDAAGADVRRVYFMQSVHELDADGKIKERCFSLQKDIDALDRMLSQHVGGIDVVTIDPVSAYLGGGDSHNDADMRGLLMPIASLAVKHNVAVIVIGHLNKSSQLNAMYRVIGSLAFVAAPRAAYAVVRDQDDKERRLLLPIKNNIGNDKTGFAYRVEANADNVPVVIWETEPVEFSLAEMADTVSERTPRPVEQAERWLEGVLSAGSAVLVNNLKEQAKSEGYSWATVRRAQKKLGIKPSKDRFDGQWTWKLPAVSQDIRYMAELVNDEGAQVCPVTK